MGGERGRATTEKEKCDADTRNAARLHTVVEELHGVHALGVVLLGEEDAVDEVGPVREDGEDGEEPAVPELPLHDARRVQAAERRPAVIPCPAAT